MSRVPDLACPKVLTKSSANFEIDLDKALRFALMKGCVGRNRRPCPEPNGVHTSMSNQAEDSVLTDKHDDHDSGRGGGHGDDRDVVVTVLAPNNTPREMNVDLHDRVDKVAREAVKAFVHDHQMEPMVCSLALIVDGVATKLDDTARLEEVGVRKHSRLSLIPKNPKTDG